MLRDAWVPAEGGKEKQVGDDRKRERRRERENDRTFNIEGDWIFF